MLNSFSFCLSVKLLIYPSYLNEILAWYSNLGCRFFSFITLSMPCHSLLVWRVSIERSAVILVGITLCVICHFSLAAFNICSLCLIFVNVINMCLGDSPWVYPIWDFLGFLNLGGYFLPHFRDVFNYYLLKYFLMPFLFIFFWDSYDLKSIRLLIWGPKVQVPVQEPKTNQWTNIFYNFSWWEQLTQN